ncbi:MAG: winged helix-turn-helix transcriptional regulator [Polyangiaceae bacterium]|nr:winged helix-turn-helix transcriptional regulator [Myxococcales bacterium]MCB9587886.1 winged helix-turn-helix transcriptional regulator [Polyangiaceae bacterium]MCB9608835.1 winged helix-turn-helix transcriptional regulator [Polyangiaceae bacterium]
MDAVAAAIAHPTRRCILELLRSGALSAGQIAEHFSDSRPAISRHLRVLREAALVTATNDGREIHYVRCLDALAPLEHWLQQLRAPSAGERWQRRFDALETEVQRVRRRPQKNHTETPKKAKESVA